MARVQSNHFQTKKQRWALFGQKFAKLLKYFNIPSQIARRKTLTFRGWGPENPQGGGGRGGTPLAGGKGDLEIPFSHSFSFLSKKKSPETLAKSQKSVGFHHSGKASKSNFRGPINTCEWSGFVLTSVSQRHVGSVPPTFPSPSAVAHVSLLPTIWILSDPLLSEVHLPQPRFQFRGHF